MHFKRFQTSRQLLARHYLGGVPSAFDNLGLPGISDVIYYGSRTSDDSLDENDENRLAINIKHRSRQI
jgi:hypothetical protein